MLPVFLRWLRGLALHAQARLNIIKRFLSLSIGHRCCNKQGLLTILGLYIICLKRQRPDSQHFIFFVTYEHTAISQSVCTCQAFLDLCCVTLV
jgi:hypothetical protein